MTTPTLDGSPTPDDPSTNPASTALAALRLATAIAVVVGLTSAPYMSLWRWVVGSYNDVQSWPYRLAVWGPLSIAALWLVVDVILPVAYRRRPLPPVASVTTVATASLGVWILLSIAWSDDRWHSATHGVLAVLVLSSAAWFGLGLSSRHQVTALFVGTQAATVGSLLAVVVTESARYSPFVGDRSWIGLFGNPNALGPVAALAALTVGAVWPAVTGVPARIALAGLLAIDVVVVLGATSYTAWFALVAAVAAWCGTALLRRLQASGRESIALTVQIAVGAVLVTAPVTVRVISGWFGKDPSLSGRTIAWRYAIDAATRRPLHGYGFAAFWHEPTHQFGYMEESGRDWIASSHSSFVDVAVDLGFVGLIAVVTISAVGVVGTCHRATRSGEIATGLWAAVAVFTLVENLAESMMAMHTLFWMLLVASAFVAGRRTTEPSPMPPIPGPYAAVHASEHHPVADLV